MKLSTRDEFLAVADQMEVARVRSQLNSGWYNHEEAAWAREWLEKRDGEIENERRKQETEKSERALAAAERSAEAAQNAARGSMWTAVIALLTVALPMLQKCIGEP